MSLIRFFAFALAMASPVVASVVPTNAPPGWETSAPREEIKPNFSFRPRDLGKGTFVITTDSRPGLHGLWHKAFPVKGGGHYRFSASRKVENVPSPRRNDMRASQ